jgi:hypothetical protein
VFTGDCEFYAVTQEQVALLTRLVLVAALNGAPAVATDLT